MCLPNIFAQHCIFEVVLTLAEVEKIFQAHVKNSLQQGHIFTSNVPVLIRIFSYEYCLFYSYYFTQTFNIQPILDRPVGQILDLILSHEPKYLPTPGIEKRWEIKCSMYL